MTEQDSRVANRPPYRRLMKDSGSFRDAFREFEQLHGAEWADLVLVLVSELMHIQRPERFEIGFSLVDAKLREDKKSLRVAMAKSAALIRHAENHAMKLQVFGWLDENMSRFRSMDAAAEAIAGKVVPLAFRTVRGWVSEWKKLRSAGRP